MKQEREATILSTPSNKEVRRTMKTREEVAHMLRLRRQGLTPYRKAAVLGCSRATVVRYLRQKGWRPMAKARRLEGLEPWLEERFLRHGGNADVVRQELREQHGIEVSLRTVERAVQPRRQRLRTTRLACVRFESPPGVGDNLECPTFVKKKCPTFEAFLLLNSACRRGSGWRNWEHVAFDWTMAFQGGKRRCTTGVQEWK